MIVTTGRCWYPPAKNATKTIPIVMVGNPDPVKEGFVAVCPAGRQRQGFSGISY